MYSSSLGDNKPKELPRPTSPLEDIAPFGRVRLIAFDLDGTMLRDQSSLPGPRFLKLRRSAGAYGVRMTLATGRTLWGARRVIEALGGLKNTPVILYNGSVVIDSGSNRLIQRLTVTSQAMAEIVRQSHQVGATTFIYEFRDPVIKGNTDTDWPETVFVIAEGRETIHEFNGMTPVFASLDQIANVLPSAILVLPNNAEQCNFLVAKLSLVDGISVTNSGGRYIEIRPAGASKADGIRILADAQNFRRDQVLAVGDNDNDVELMRWAGLSVAVSSASEAARNAATHLSRHGPENAAIEVLDLVRQAKRLEKGRGVQNAQTGSADVG